MYNYILQIDYHVVFLDKNATRCWVKVSDIKKYEGGDSPGPVSIEINHRIQDHILLQSQHLSYMLSMHIMD